jgi:hypothetical protein
LTEEQHQFQQGVLILADHVVIGFLPLLLDRYMAASELCREVSSDGNVFNSSTISISTKFSGMPGTNERGRNLATVNAVKMACIGNTLVGGSFVVDKLRKDPPSGGSFVCGGGGDYQINSTTL